MARFDLVEEQWIPVVDRKGVSRTVGLAEVLLTAHESRGIVGETPPMTAALYRLVLALAHRVYGPVDDDAWGGLGRAEGFAEQPLRNYLTEFPDRFDLFDERRPFLQCPAVATRGASSAAKLVPHRAVGNNTTLFDHTTAADEVILDPDEAARWLVTLQAYDPGGLKTPYRSDKSSERAPCNWFGMVLIEGATLKETLLLNMLRYHPAEQQPRMTTDADRPVWEAEQPPPPEPRRRTPDGWTDVLTWPSRRVWLSSRSTPTTTVVDGVVITPGDRRVGDLPDTEWMAAYRRPDRKGAGLFPVRLAHGRGVWRFSRELLLAGNRSWQRSYPLEQLSARVEAGHIPPNAVYTLRIFGQQLDPKATIVRQVLEESVVAPVALLRAEDPRVGRIIGHAVSLAADAGRALRDMQREHAAEFSAEAAADLELAYWPHLPRPFDTFLRDLGAALTAGSGEFAAADAWAVEVARNAHQAAQRWAEGSPRRGRSVLAAGACYGRFTGKLHHLGAVFRSHASGFALREDAA